MGPAAELIFFRVTRWLSKRSPSAQWNRCWPPRQEILRSDYGTFQTGKKFQLSLDTEGVLMPSHSVRTELSWRQVRKTGPFEFGMGARELLSAHLWGTTAS